MIAGCLAACQTAGVSFQNAALSSRDTARPIAGLLKKPDGPGPFPAVVILHTCGGVQPHVSYDWPQYLSGLGYVTLTVDSFGARGLGPCPNTLHATPPLTNAYREMTRDAYGALDHLARQPYVRADRVAVVGFSLGANVINSYLVHNLRTSGEKFRAAIGIYGRCHDLRGAPGIPLMELAGELDVRHVNECRRLAHAIEVHVLAGAHHSWDDPQASGKTTSYGDYMLYDRRVTERSRELVRDFLARYLR